MPKVLVIEKKASIQTLLKRRFVGDSVSVDSVPVIDQAMEQFMATGYDVLIWDAVPSPTVHS
jgi:DNA-binding response OmpR family regulator